MNRLSFRNLIKLLSITFFWFAALPVAAQDDSGLGDIVIPRQQLPLCFGFSDVNDPSALAICDALNLRENVKARELSEQWVRSEPDSPAAQFALAEVLLTVEGNMPRALFHLNRAEELTPYSSLEEAFESGNVQWHYLTISQLSYVHQLMGDQIRSLEYLEKMESIYGQDVESFRGWPLIKLKQYDAARASAYKVLETEDSVRARARAWNTICAADLASLAPIETNNACDRAIAEDESAANQSNSSDTVYLTNASEVALSLLEIDQAEDYLNRATRFLNPDSVADPWIYRLYLTLNQGRFDEARSSLDRMLLWRQQQEPLVSAMNRAEHFLVSASFLLIAGYAEDAAKLSQTALNQPDRNGSYSADDAQKDAYAALINMHANRAQLEIEKEQGISLGWSELPSHQLRLFDLRLQAWRAERRAASLFASFDTLQNRVRPYAPLDVHIPEWLEPELVAIIGTGIMNQILDQALANGAFQLNDGYYHAYKTEIHAQEGNIDELIRSATTALAKLPGQEILLRARVSARLAQAHWQRGEAEEAHAQFIQAISQDPSVIRRLQTSLPAELRTDGTALAQRVSDLLSKSPRFATSDNGLVLNITAAPELSICLRSRSGEALSCYTSAASESESMEWNAAELVKGFHTNAFGLGFDISQAQRAMLLGSSVILSSQIDPNAQRNREAFLRP